jgi:hypothetical protein
MSKHGIGAIADSAQKFGAGIVDVAQSAQTGTVNALHTLQHLGVDDVLGVIGLQRRRSAFSLGSFLGGAAIGAGIMAVAVLAIPQAPKARRAVRHFVRSAVAKATPENEREQHGYQNGHMHHDATV